MVGYEQNKGWGSWIVLMGGETQGYVDQAIVLVQVFLLPVIYSLFLFVNVGRGILPTLLNSDPSYVIEDRTNPVTAPPWIKAPLSPSLLWAYPPHPLRSLLSQRARVRNWNGINHRKIGGGV